VLRDEWKLYHFEWPELRQAGWGVGVVFDPKKVNAIFFQVSETETRGKSAEFSLDNVAFFRDAPDATPITRARSRAAP
jgi:hypothetical protein